RCYIQDILLQSGESVHVPLRTHHRFWNRSDQPTIFTGEIRPAQHFEQAMRASFGLAQEGKVNKAGVPTNLWQLALVNSGSSVTSVLCGCSIYSYLRTRSIPPG